MAIVVLHLIPSLAGGGAERQVSYLIPALVACGVNAHLAYVHDGPNLERLKGMENRIHKLPASNNHDPRLYLEIRRLIHRLSPDVIQTWLTQMDILGGSAALIRRIPFVLSERSVAGAYNKSLKNLTRKRLGLNAAAIVANSLQGLTYWESKGRGPKMLVIPNGMPFAEMASVIDTSEKKTHDKEVLLFAGRYADVKNVKLTLQAFIRVLDRRPSIHAYMFGGGSLKTELKNMAKQSSHRQRIHVCDYTHELWKWMNQADVFVSLSLHEGQPNTILEAAKLGCPLVLSDIPAHREIIGTAGARLLNPVSVESAFDAIMDVFENRRETDRKAATARQMIADYSVERCAARYRELYNELCAYSAVDQMTK